MSSLSNELHQDNGNLKKWVEAAMHYVGESARSGAVAHDVEKRVFDYALQFGRKLLGAFFHAQGDGDSQYIISFSIAHLAVNKLAYF